MIAAADALSPETPEEKQSPSILKRIFSVKSKARRIVVDKRTAEVKTIEEEVVQSARKTSLRDRWRQRV